MFFKILAFAFAVETGFLSGGVWNYSDRNVGWVDVGALYPTMEARVEAGPVYVNGTHRYVNVKNGGTWSGWGLITVA